ncbi:MAG TPA: hypothetical protein VFZ95_09165 [Steroidobacteraceae bacterium]
MKLPPLSFKAIAIAFAAELGVDSFISLFVFGAFAGDSLKQGMTDAEFQEVARQVTQTTTYVPWMMMFGTATTVGGGYLAARLARNIPYYHGLAMGILGILFILVTWDGGLGWMNFLGLLVTVPASLYGAHLAKKHMAATPE